VEVEILTSKPMRKGSFALLSKKWKVRYGDSESALVFSLTRISEIPKVVRDVVARDGDIISVLYLKESIDKVLQGE
jgi:hypothetical protein